jgi:flagellar motor switch protein FliG
MSDAASRGFERGTARDRGFEHVAKFLLLLGGDAAARVLPRLTAGEVTGIIEEVTRTGSVEQREAFRILEEFGYLMETRELHACGGVAAARAMLRAAFGESRAAPVPEPLPAPADPVSGCASEELSERVLLEAEEQELRRALDERSDRQLACALAAASGPVARRLRACLAPPRRASVEARSAHAAGTLAAEQAGALRALMRQVERSERGAEERLEC